MQHVSEKMVPLWGILRRISYSVYLGELLHLRWRSEESKAKTLLSFFTDVFHISDFSAYLKSYCVL